MRAALRLGRFRSVSDARAFAERLRPGRDTGLHVRPVAQVLRRAARPLLQRLWIPLHFALRLIQRAAAPWSAPLPAASAPPPFRAQGMPRERFHLCTRLLERLSSVLRIQREPMPVSSVLPAPSVRASGPAPGNVLSMRHIERQAFFPRVTQILARAPAAANIARQAASPPAAPEPEPWPRSLGGKPRGAPPAASSLAAVELARVTDHVIRQLDQRVLSYRERTGQN